MATPIRERGIRWAETYGDKSAYLKEQMDQQIGPGSYLRWEGHDVTTNTDYYVVLSPGFSKKKGYHFFAGLRKMPADHGASGKKFRTQREAMSYARQMWRVPPPQVKPVKPGGYMLQDIMGKSIVLEPQHDSSKKSSAGRDTRLASVQNTLRHGGMHESWSPYVISDRLCWAHKASPVLGFMPALYSKARFIGTDVYDQPTNERGYNEFTQQPETLPLAPMVATYQQPDEKKFDAVVNKHGVVVHNDLVKVDRKEGKVLGYQYLPKFSEKPAEGYTQTTWRDMQVSPSITIPPTVVHGSRNLWSTLKALTVEVKGAKLPAVTLPEEISQFADTGNMPKKAFKNVKSFGDPLTVGITVRAEAYQKVKALAEQARCVVEVKKGEQKDLVDLVSLQGDKFDWDEPYFESIKLSGSQLMVYNHGLPNRLVASEQRRTDAEADVKGGEKAAPASGGTFYYMVKDPIGLVSSYASTTLASLGAMAELEAFLNDPREPGGKRTKGTAALWDTKLRRMADIVNSMGFYDQEVAPGDVLGMSEDLKPVITESIAGFVNSFREAMVAGQAVREDEHAAKLADAGSRYAAARADVEQTWQKSQIPAKKAALDKIQSEMAHYLLGFRKLAENGVVKLTHDMFLDSRTCAPKLVDYHMESYDVEKFMIPMSGGRVNKNVSEKMEKTFQPYAPDFSVEAPAAASGGHAARRWDVNRNQVVFGPLPAGANPKQGSATGLKGVRSLFAKGYAKMAVNKPGGGTHEIIAGEMPEYQTKPGPGGPEFITGGLHDVIIAPEKSSSRGSDLAMYKAGINRFGFVLMTQDHSVENKDGVVKTRQHASSPFTGKDPESSTNKDFYTAADGTDLSEYATKKGSNVFFTSTEVIRLLVEKHLGIKDEDLGPFTPMTVQDLRIIDHYATDGMRYYMSVEKYREAAKSKDARFLDEAGMPKPPAPEHDQEIVFDAQLIREGHENSKALDQAKYEYGRLCYECSGKKNISPDAFKGVLAEFKQAIENPQEAFKPKQIDLFGLLYLEEAGQTDEQGQPVEDQAWFKDKDGTDMVFGTETAARDFMEHSEARGRAGIHVEKYIEKAHFPYSMHVAREFAAREGQDPEAVSLTRNKDMVISHIGNLRAQEAEFEQPPVAPGQPAAGQPAQPAPGQPAAGQPAQPAPAVPGPAQPAVAQPTQPPAKPAKAMSRLIALANKLDLMGRRAEADAVDRVLRTSVQRGTI
jgi:hypothetical protein